MSRALDIVLCGAVTAVGLDAAQTCAALRAGLARFAALPVLPPPHEPVLAAAVPARRHVKSTPTVWLANLAARALRECLRPGRERGRVALLLVVPEASRRHPAFDAIDPESFRTSLGKYLGQDFHERSCTVPGGHAGTQEALERADQLFSAHGLDECIIGGVDSLLNERDLERLRASHRLEQPDGSQGVIPGEAAAFVRVRPAAPKGVAIARILGSGRALERDPADGERWSQGRGLEACLAAAAGAAGIAESALSLRISDMNGERYRAWETVLSEFRYYRTPRPALPTWYPAAGAGDVGAASGALQLVVAATAMARGYAPGPLAMCETSSDAGRRGASVVGPAASAPTPPFSSVRAWHLGAP